MNTDLVIGRSIRFPAETAERHARFEALRTLLPRLENMNIMPTGVNLVALESEAIEREANDLSYAEVFKNGSANAHAWAVARNRLTPIIAEQFKTLGADGYLRKKLASQSSSPAVLSAGAA